MVNLAGGLDRSGCVLRYADSGGSGDAVVLTHGAGADHHMFDAQFEALAASGQRAVVWDMRAHGESTPNNVPFTAELALQDLSALVEHLDLSHPVLAGHSLGGNLSQALVRSQPPAIRRTSGHGFHLEHRSAHQDRTVSVEACGASAEHHSRQVAPCPDGARFGRDTRSSLGRDTRVLPNDQEAVRRSVESHRVVR